MKAFIAVFIVIGAFAKSDLAFSQSSADVCASVVEALDSEMPLQIDEVTTLTRVECGEDVNGYKLTYVNIVSVDATEIPLPILQSMKITFRDQWCTAPDQLALLNLMNIEYSYVNQSQQPIGSVAVLTTECANVSRAVVAQQQASQQDQSLDNQRRELELLEEQNRILRQRNKQESSKIAIDYIRWANDPATWNSGR